MPEVGDFVELRGRRWLVEAADPKGSDLAAVRLSCISDDAQGEALEVLWDAEIGAQSLDDDSWRQVGRGVPDTAQVLAAHIRAIRWNTATAADRDLLQAPFRAGIRLDSYQLLPLRKALRLPRVNLLIADDVGLGKTIEAGLVVRELLLRLRIDLVVVTAPASMTAQWKDELESKFGLSFVVIDRERVAEIRRTRGFTYNPWRTGSRFIISHSLLADETYAAGLRDVLGEFRSRALFILDEAHHAAPSGGARYAISSQFTKAVRDMAERFEHRLFLSATPHNGHSNSFAALLEMLDPQRFERGIDVVRPKDLEPVMVRRLKADLRRLGHAFPARRIEALVLDGLPDDAPELALSRKLGEYGKLRWKRISKLPAHKAALAKLAFVGLQQRLLSSIAAFERTLKVHRTSLQRLLDREVDAAEVGAAGSFVAAVSPDDSAELDLEDGAAEQALDADEDAATEAATVAGAEGATADALRAEVAMVDDMLRIAEPAARRPDARIRWLVQWIEQNMLDGNAWNQRRLILFTEYEDTRRWLERRLREAFAGTDRADDRIGIFTGATGADRREEVKRAFNANPATEPLRILVCTDAAREGINLQTWCADLVHIDLPWNPSRLEQRNGRIDRKLQPAKEVVCRYFRYAQRETDVVLDALVRKTERIRDQLGSAGQVIEERITKRLAQDGIVYGIVEAKNLAREIEEENDADRLRRAVTEMDDEERARDARLRREEADLNGVLEESRQRVGVEPEDLRHVVGAALSRIGFDLDKAEGDAVGRVKTYHFGPNDSAFGKDAGWDDAFDDLRVRPRKRGERLGDWRRDAPIRSIAFEPPVLPDNRDADNVVQVHVEHRLVRRLLSRFLSQGFQSNLSRVSVIEGPGAQPRIVVMARLSLYGPAAARLHEEIIQVTAVWTDADRDRKPLKPFGEVGEAKTLDQLEHALRGSHPAPERAVARVQATVQQDMADLVPTLEATAQEQLVKATAQLARRGEQEAKSLTILLESQRTRIGKASADAEKDDPNQFTLPGVLDDERRERQAVRRYWAQRLERLEREIRDEPARIRASYEVRAHRLEPVGVIYLWPATS
jgi:ERCC4-related helicase